MGIYTSTKSLTPQKMEMVRNSTSIIWQKYYTRLDSGGGLFFENVDKSKINPNGYFQAGAFGHSYSGYLKKVPSNIFFTGKTYTGTNGDRVSIEWKSNTSFEMNYMNVSTTFNWVITFFN